MATRSLPSPYSTYFGLGLPLLFVVFPAFVAVATMPFVFVSNMLSVNWSHQALNLGFLTALGIAYVAWSVGAARFWWTRTSGIGFCLAGYGLSQRLACEFWMSMFGVPAREVWPESGFGGLVTFTRVSGLIAFVFGLAMVVATCIWERRIARQAPGWARPR